MKLTKEKYFSICEKSGFAGAKINLEGNKNNFYLPIEVAPLFLSQFKAFVFSWYNDKCYSFFQHEDEEVITTVEELQNKIERYKKIYECECKDAMKKMVAKKKKEIQKASEGFEA